MCEVSLVVIVVVVFFFEYSLWGRMSGKNRAQVH